MWESFVIAGRADETYVARQILKNLGGKIDAATPDEDMHQHVDLWWTTPDGCRLGIDVKGLKRRSRHDDRVNDEDTWIETMNVLGGPGWVYGGADYIAFRRTAKTVFVLRDRLAAYIEGKIAGKGLWTRNPHQCYVPYRRASTYPPRLDVITLVPLNDIEAIKDFELPNL